MGSFVGECLWDKVTQLLFMFLLLQTRSRFCVVRLDTIEQLCFVLFSQGAPGRPGFPGQQGEPGSKGEKVTNTFYYADVWTWVLIVKINGLMYEVETVEINTAGSL